MKLLKYIVNWNYHSLVNWTNKLESQVNIQDYKKAIITDEKIINKFNYGIDHEEWVRLTRIRMKLHFKSENITQAWQLGNNLLHMMGDDDPATIELYNEVSFAKDRLA